jgi:hypothetical protein
MEGHDRIPPLRAVFGAARRWFQTPNHIPAEEMAARIETMVNPVLFGASQ